MAIFFRHHHGRADGKYPYMQSRAADNPPPFAFYGTRDTEKPDEEPTHVSVYRFNGTIENEGDDTIWHYDFFHHSTHADAIRLMRDQVAPDEKDW